MMMQIADRLTAITEMKASEEGLVCVIHMPIILSEFESWELA